MTKSLDYKITDTDILSKIVAGYHSKIVGEENNIKLLWLACISKDLPKRNRLSAIITSQSSAGKSNLVNSVLMPFHEDVIDFTDYTPAFLSRQEVIMNGKILKMEQIERTNDKKQVSISNLKFLLTEGVLKIGLVDKNEKGKNVPKTLQVNGIPVFISTSTNYNIDPETLNRTLLMQVDESEFQTKKVISHIINSYEHLSVNNNWNNDLKELEKLARLFKEHAKQIRDIVVPFGRKLESKIPVSDVTIRRDLPKILNLTCVVAFTHIANRTCIRNNNGEQFIDDQFGNTEKYYTYTIIAEPSDFQEAIKIAGTTITQTINKINQSSIEMYEKFMDVYRQKISENSISGQNTTLDNDNIIDVGITIKELTKITYLSQNRTRELMSQLLTNGFVSREKTKSREFEYYPTGKKFENIKFDELDYTKEELEKWVKKEISENKELEIVYPKNSVFVS
ncbi:hypothetical protein BD31_I0914 [Candidatus Nitrosopumilus salaria BD31]|uniref:Uncharacterized protein n=1 Tax=Candidatus Nitrosopumilus salarius BD31 TaxID=859350 RepID=I3CZQ5_9ARCH|nr:hypothetical protein [Candidatus Nitrosopumilus salaria]EIJ64948.1 hypothetical protein BD31_I0914 [Candidatus Nitrosopumilus salaria BD31]